MLEPGCGCPACAGGFTRAYLHHLVRQHEILGATLVSLHNLYFLLELMRRARQSILDGTYGSFVRDWMDLPVSREF